MDRQLYRSILAELKLTKTHLPCRAKYTDQQIVAVYYYAVLNNRPVSWACVRSHWWINLLSYLFATLPSQSQMSRRLRTTSVRQLLLQIEEQVLRPEKSDSSSESLEIVWYIDGKPLMVSPHTHDRQSGYGHAAGGQGRGYKLHLLWGNRGTVASYRVTPMNRDERPMARRMLNQVSIEGYLVGDANYDDDKIHRMCEQMGNLKFITPSRMKGKGFGHRKISDSRRDCMLRQRAPKAHFIFGMLRQRDAIERTFSQQTCVGEGLWALPPWVRTYKRVQPWVQAKLVLHALRRKILNNSYVN